MTAWTWTAPEALLERDVAGGMPSRSISAQRPLTGVEELLWLLDAPGEPQNVRLALALPGAIDLERLRRAVASVMAAHPMAAARLTPWNAETRALTWCVPSAPDDDPVLVPGDHDDEALVGSTLSLDRSPAWRLAIGPGRLVLCAHHAALDLGSGMRVLQDLALAYREPDDELPADPPHEARRGTAPPRRDTLRYAAGMARRAWAPAARLASVPSSAGGGYLLTERLLDVRTLDHRRHAPAARADLLAAAAHRAIASFNATLGQPAERIVLLTAIGTPRAHLVPRPVENAWVPTVSETRGADRADPRQLLERLAAQRRRARVKDGPAATAALATASGSPVWAKRMIAALHPLTRHRLEETAALTYLGEVGAYDFGPAGRSSALVLDGPARPPKGLFIGAVVHEQTLCLGYRGSAAQLDRPALERLADEHVRELAALG